MNEQSAAIMADGIVVGATPTGRDGVRFAVIEPAGSRWLPWPSRTSRWWYEIHEEGQPDEHGITRSTWAYTEGGSGGGFTLASCMRKALAALDSMPVAGGYDDA